MVDVLVCKITLALLISIESVSETACKGRTLEVTLSQVLRRREQALEALRFRVSWFGWFTQMLHVWIIYLHER